MIKALNIETGSIQELRTQADATFSIANQLHRIGRKKAEASGVYKKLINGYKVKIGNKKYYQE